MVDWDLVDRRRSRGWDWDRIAADPKVGFHAEEASGEPGRALRTLYYQRRSKAKRRGEDDGGAAGEGEGSRTHSPIATLGFVLTPLLAIWFVVALALPSTAGTLFPAIPWIGLLLAAGAFLLAFGLLRSLERWNRQLRTAAVIGIVLGFAVSGGITALALVEGCPTLQTTTTGEPQSWLKASNPAWTEDGAPVLFSYGSVACPYCSASTWAVVEALKAFGSVSGITYDHSSPTDVFPNTPEIVLSGLTLQSPYVALHILESTNDQTITNPGASSCVDQAYISTYDNGGGIPFMALGGKYVHSGAIVTPSVLRTDPNDQNSAPLTPAQVNGQIQNQSGSAWSAIAPATYLLEAFIVELNHGEPTNIANDPNVSPYLKQIS
ncbi:MAG TPA: DUF929 family protein [Thermoplasmata archaeon]|nr:DUF929 family protein [Thermoplasmata archaeon]